jgi:hypothetical protein
MDHYAGIDVSLECSSVCIVDANGKIVRETKVASEPEALIAWFRSLGLEVARIGLEAGPLSQWLYASMGRVPDFERLAGLAVSQTKIGSSHAVRRRLSARRNRPADLVPVICLTLEISSFPYSLGRRKRAVEVSTLFRSKLQCLCQKSHHVHRVQIRKNRNIKEKLNNTTFFLLPY